MVICLGMCVVSSGMDAALLLCCRLYVQASWVRAMCVMATCMRACRVKWQYAVLFTMYIIICIVILSLLVLPIPFT